MIFDKYSMNTTKYLDFQALKEAFTLYFERAGLVTQELKDKILALKNVMNTSRTYWEFPLNHEININKF